MSWLDAGIGLRYAGEQKKGASSEMLDAPYGSGYPDAVYNPYFARRDFPPVCSGIVPGR